MYITKSTDFWTIWNYPDDRLLTFLSPQLIPGLQSFLQIIVIFEEGSVRWIYE